MAALFVVVEGFSKCGLKDARVRKLLNAHLGELKAMRHEMFHFVPRVNAKGHEVIDKINWASELHEAIGEYIGEQAQIELRKEGAAKQRLSQPKRRKQGGRRAGRLRRR